MSTHHPNTDYRYGGWSAWSPSCGAQTRTRSESCAATCGGSCTNRQATSGTQTTCCPRNAAYTYVARASSANVSVFVNIAQHCAYPFIYREYFGSVDTMIMLVKRILGCVLLNSGIFFYVVVMFTLTFTFTDVYVTRYGSWSAWSSPCGPATRTRNESCSASCGGTCTNRQATVDNSLTACPTHAPTTAPTLQPTQHPCALFYRTICFRFVVMLLC